ncbi:hypothetical protein EJ06DRAFT_471542 [Trichodelitschia bisporula]|uniref:DUF6987 domain-containing protein n=1 Tax=Trichodelitschia bisporula TaxID=703511 RepID=A0A6G1I6H5_9PEZI|nr:hypothetical protein EJ06DRAFT_471542 [Trichodelitschia bisporula]
MAGDTAGETDAASDEHRDEATEQAPTSTVPESVEEAEDTENAPEEAEAAPEAATEAVEESAETAKSTTEDATGQAADQAAEDPLDLSILKGLEVDQEGLIHDKDGNPVGKLAEGDAEDLVGYPIADNGEILDDDGDLVGRCELLPESERKAASGDDAEEADEPKLPGVEILKGLTCDRTGLILNDDGDTVGQLYEGNPAELAGKPFNERGEILDEDGNVIGRARVHPEAANLLPQEEAEGATEDVKDEAEKATEETGDAIDDAKEGAGEVGQELPGIEALEGHDLNSVGEVVDDEGNVLGKLTEGEAKDVKGMTINDKGEVLDEEGNIIGKVELAEGAQEILAQAGQLDLRILDGLKVNKKGKILDEEGEPIGELIEGDAAQCARKTVNDKGEVLDDKGKVIGKVRVIPGDAAYEAVKALHERLGDKGPTLPGLEILNGLKVNKKGKILDEEGEPIGELVDGDVAACAGKTCNDKGEVLDKDGKVIGRVKTLPQQGEEEAPEAVEEPAPEGEEGDAELVEGQEPEDEQQPEEETGPELPPLSILEGLVVNKAGKLVDKDGNVVGELIEGDAKKLSKMRATCDKEGQFWDNKGHIIGRAQTVPQEERDEEGQFAGLEGLIVNNEGKVVDENGNIVGEIVEGELKKLVGRAVDEDGDILDKNGTIIGHAERWEQPEAEQEPEAEKPDLSILAGKKLNKQGNVIGDDGIPIGRLVEGNAKELAGKKVDGEGQIWDDEGHVVGRCELIPANERVHKTEGPFAGLEGLRVVKDGFVEDEDGNRVGRIVDGNAKRLVGLSVDEDGDIIDKYGNVKGHAEPYEEEEAPEADLSALKGCTVNKAGNVVDSSGKILGRVAEGDLKNLIGRSVDGQGQIWDNSGQVIGRAELVQGADTAPDGPFSGFDNVTVHKDGLVKTPDGDVVGRVIEGDVKKLVGHKVDEDGDITDKKGNTIGKAERWEPEEKERRVNPMSGLRVNKEGEVRDNNGDIIGRLTAGDLGHCTGFEIDDNGYVVDNDGNKVGEVTLLENIAPEEEEGLTEEEQEELRKKKEDAELANKMSAICTQTLERIQPVCKQITDYIEAADRTPRDELDEEELVNNVKPLIEEGGRILSECNGSLRGLDPDGRIAAQAKGRSATREATPEEYALADNLKELTTTVVTTIDNAKKKIQDMPHAKKKLNPLWGLLTEPLFQIIAAVGLLLAGVLGLVGRLLNGLGLGGLVSGLLGGLGIDKLLSGLGLGSLSESILGKKKKKGGASNIPIVGGLMGGK